LYTVLCIIFLLFSVVIAFGAGLIQLNYFVKSINKGSNKGISFTFDDGPDSSITPQILDLLNKENVKATFFVIGKKIDPNLLIRIHSEGHTIGNHTFNHSRTIASMSTTSLIKEINACAEKITEVIGKSPQFFRPPYGVTTPRFNRALKQLKMQSIGWTLRSFDTVEKNETVLKKKIISKLKNGTIVLFHDTQTITLNIVPDIIAHCKENGIKIVPLPTLINADPYV